MRLRPSEEASGTSVNHRTTHSSSVGSDSSSGFSGPSGPSASTSPPLGSSGEVLRICTLPPSPCTSRVTAVTSVGSSSLTAKPRPGFMPYVGLSYRSERQMVSASPSIAWPASSSLSPTPAEGSSALASVKVISTGSGVGVSDAVGEGEDVVGSGDGDGEEAVGEGSAYLLASKEVRASLSEPRASTSATIRTATIARITHGVGLNRSRLPGASPKDRKAHV